MADKGRKTKFYILILMAVLALTAVLPLLGAGPESALALEQSLRCGMEEHVHSEDCYIGDVLVCSQRAHSHGEDCYLVKLEDNDINGLLSLVDSHESKSLECVITDTLSRAEEMDSALVLSGGSAWTAVDDGDPVTNDDIVMLNHAITDGALSSSLVMNENLSSLWSSDRGMSESQVISMLGGVSSGNVSTYAVGGTPSTRNNTINFYILLDGKITFINSRSFDNTSGTRQCSYSNIVNSYTSSTSLVTNLSTGTLKRNDSTYYIRYNRDGDVSSSTSFDNISTHRDSSIRFSNNSSPHYGILSYEQYETDPVPFYTVTLDYSAVGGTNQVRYVEEGLNSGLSLSDEYLWYDEDGNQVSGTTPGTITETTTLYARPKSITVTYTVGGSEVLEITDLKHNSTYTVLNSIDNVDLSGYGAWRDTATGTIYRFSDSAAQRTITLNSNKDFVAVKNVTASFSGTADPETVLEGETITLPELPEGYVWNDGENSYAGGSKVTLNKNTTFTSVPGCAVSFTRADGTTSTEIYSIGDKVTIPALSDSGNYWMDEDGTEYSAGDTVTVTKDYHFTERSSITINYTVNFPSSLNNKTLYSSGGIRGGDSSLAVGVPELPNADSSYTIDSFRYPDAPHTVERLNYREVFYRHSGDPAYEYRSVYMLGWQVTANGVTELYQPGETINWAKLEALAAAGDGTIDFSGLWEYDGLHTVTFYINYAAEAANANGDYSGGSAEDYTPEVFCGHIFGIPEGVSYGNTANKYYGISGANAIKSVDADTNIRKLYGTGVSYDGINNILGGSISGGSSDYAATLYMTDFPTDAEVLAKIKAWAEAGYFSETLKYDDGAGNSFDVPYSTVDGSKDYYNLDTDHYAIRWYVFKSQDDGWHVDGRLIKKVGTVKVNKNFGGNAALTVAAIEQAEEDFANGEAFVTAVCEGYYQTVGGVESFVEYDANKRRTVQLYFTPLSEAQPYGYEYDPETDTYFWVIEDVEAKEKWVVTENPPDISDALDLSEWVWVDSFSGTTDSGLSASTTVTGITHAADSYSEDWLTVDFNNVYHRANTILIRKVDGTTMNGLSGAVFNIYDGSGQLMHFVFNSKTQIYEWSPAGEGQTDLTVGEDGFLEYALSGFSYETGNITVREKTPPSGYALVGDVEIGYMKDGDGNYLLNSEGDKIIGIISSESDEAASYASGVLTVKNYSDGEATVRAEKVWDCDESYYSDIAVRFELFANGKVASAAIPGFSDSYGSYFVYLDAKGAYFQTNASGQPIYVSQSPWSYTWEGLPTVLSGEAIVYSIVETQVGDEAADSSGNFPNWISDTLRNDVSTDSLGNQSVEIAVRNTPNRAMIRLTKYDMGGSLSLPGAVFTLSELNDDGSDAGSSVTDTTDQYGVITFDNLKYETWYLLREDQAPESYVGMNAPVYLRLAQNGVVTVTTDMNDTSKASSYAYYPNQANNVYVLNMYAGPLPETGGTGTWPYILSGGLLCAAAALIIYLRSRRKEDAPYV